jgi:hypothetical protein
VTIVHGVSGFGLAAASVAISPAPFRGVLPLPLPALRTASVALDAPHVVANASASHVVSFMAGSRRLLLPMDEDTRHQKPSVSSADGP